MQKSAQADRRPGASAVPSPGAPVAAGGSAQIRQCGHPLNPATSLHCYASLLLLLISSEGLRGTWSARRRWGSHAPPEASRVLRPSKTAGDFGAVQGLCQLTSAGWQSRSTQRPTRPHQAAPRAGVRAAHVGGQIPGGFWRWAAGRRTEPRRGCRGGRAGGRGPAGGAAEPEPHERPMTESKSSAHPG